jgi:hypothetical protein
MWLLDANMDVHLVSVLNRSCHSPTVSTYIVKRFSAQRRISDITHPYGGIVLF